MNINILSKRLWSVLICLVCLNIGHIFATSTPRIISTDASATNLLLYLGMQDQLIAIDVTSKLPDGAKALPNIGYHRNLSAEGLLSLNPSLIVGSELMGPEHIVTTLTKADIDVVQLPSAKTALGLKDNINALSSLLGLTKKGLQLNQEIDQKLAQLHASSLENERIAFLLSMDPSKLRLAGTGTSGDAMIKLLEASNVAEFENYQNVSAESLLALEPSIIVVVGHSKNKAVEELLAAQNILKFSPAGKQNNIIGIEGGALVAGLSVAAIDEALFIARAVNQLSKVD